MSIKATGGSAAWAQGHDRALRARAGARASAGRRIVSYGTSSYGYDVRCADEFKIFTNINSTIVDPKAFDPRSFVDVKGDVCIIPPNSFALARTVEYFRIPRDVLVVCLGKSTYARCGIIVNVTPLEPEWEGHVTLEFSNTTPLPAKIYANEGVRADAVSSSPTRCARPPTGIAVASTRGSAASRCPRPDPTASAKRPWSRRGRFREPAWPAPRCRQTRPRAH